LLKVQGVRGYGLGFRAENMKERVEGVRCRGLGYLNRFPERDCPGRSLLLQNTKSHSPFITVGNNSRNNPVNPVRGNLV